MRTTPKTTRRRATARLKVSAQEKRYVNRLLAHLRRSSPVVEAVKWLLREPATAGGRAKGRDL